MLAIILGVVCAALALLSVSLHRKSRRLELQADEHRRRASEAEQQSAIAQARLADIESDDARRRDAFGATLAEHLRTAREDLVKTARLAFEKEQQQARGALDERKAAVESLVKPLQEKLKETAETLRKLEEERVREYGALRQFTATVAESGAALKIETGKLVQALRKPQVRGRYGEIQLERVVELAGMRKYCDFSVQESAINADGARLRPDMVVRLPNERIVVIDAKTNIDAYLDAIDAPSPDEAQPHLARFARHVLEQARALAKKDYAGTIGSAPEFVVMFIPGDQFIDAALEREPALLDLAAEAGVVIASPSTLIGLLRAVHVGWREKDLSDNAKELFKLGRELHERAATMLDNVAKVGQAIATASSRYNTLVGTIDGRLVPTLRKFEEAGARSAKETPTPAPIEGVVRDLRALPDASRDGG